MVNLNVFYPILKYVTSDYLYWKNSSQVWNEKSWVDLTSKGLKITAKLYCSYSCVNFLLVVCLNCWNFSFLQPRVYINLLFGLKYVPYTSASNLQAARAREPFIFKRSTRADGVISFILGTSACNRNQPSSSNNTLEFIFSLSFPLFHFYSNNRANENVKIIYCNVQKW